MEEFTACLKKMWNSKSAGHDDVFPEFLKKVNESLFTLQTRMLSKILESGDVPNDWTLSIYRILYMKGDKKDPNNNRHISFAGCLRQLFTSLITERIEKELKNKKSSRKGRLVLGKKYELLLLRLCPTCHNIDLSCRKEKTICDYCRL